MSHEHQYNWAAGHCVTGEPMPTGREEACGLVRAESPLLPIPSLVPSRCPEPSAGTGRDAVNVFSAQRHLCVTNHLQREGFPGTANILAPPHPTPGRPELFWNRALGMDMSPLTPGYSPHAHESWSLGWKGHGPSSQTGPDSNPGAKQPHLDKEGSAHGTGRARAVGDSRLSAPEKHSTHHFFLLPDA